MKKKNGKQKNIYIAQYRINKCLIKCSTLLEKLNGCEIKKEKKLTLF